MNELNGECVVFVDRRVRIKDDVRLFEMESESAIVFM